MESDKRSERRFATHQAAMITVGGLPPFECRVTDLSVTGAALWIGKHTVPDRFTLKIRGDDAILQADVQWRRDGIIGVKLQVV